MLGFFLGVVGLLSVMGALYWRWRKQIDEELAEGASIEWAHFNKHEPEFIKDMDEAKFREIYKRVHEPRFPGYAFAAFATFLLSLPITLMALTAIIWGAQATGVIPEPVDVADRLLIDDGELRFFRDTPPEAALYYVRDLGGFYYFFGVLIVWLFIVAFYMRRFHARRPGYLRDEIIRSRE
ncbi:hypothetical protein PUV54_07030 [Hyphococcus flavus]|uniref:Uncharacterized protein n=1 Tax=Hyphococcus flavus TaxID=1866326 RepID=A0AAE9ZDG1_9PROT|nr:hypothetical protein [Hyphococcus flavus]WDI32949.1 hypothetical protein PUV54_07030 [Hyphococcus flavus]